MSKANIVFFAAAFISFISCNEENRQQTANTVSLTLISYIKANEILNAAIKAHGGEEKIKALKNILLEYNGMRHMINQSRTAYAPWDKSPSLGKVVADQEHDKLYSYNSSSYPGIGAFAGVYAINGKEGFHYEPEKNYMGDEVMKITGNAIHAPWNYAKRWMPPLLLLQMLENKNSLRYSGTINKFDSELHVLNFAQPNAYTMSVYFDAKTHYFRGYEAIRDDGVYGDISDEGIFDDYRDFKGVIFPLKRTDYLNNDTAREITIKLVVDANVDTALFSYPKGYREAKEDPNYKRVIKAADGVYIDQEMGGIMFVEFKDFVAVLDCPGNFSSSYSTIQEIRKTIPGKAIKYIIPSHTHGDHGGGARGYYYIGATLVTTAGHKQFYESLASIKQSIAPDSLTLLPKKAVIEIFSDKKIITDGERTIELYNAGPNAHSEEITFAYLPQQKIIWQADMFFVPGTGNGINKAMPVTIEFAKKLKALRIDDFNFIIDGHNSRLITKEQFVESLRLGGYEF